MADDDDRRAALQRVSDAEREKVAERVRAAAADGRLGLDELDDRLGSALAARTRGDLDAVVADLGDDGVVVRPVTDAAIRADGSSVQRVGRWDVPARLTVKSSMSSVLLDFTEATFTAPSVRIDVEVSAGSLRLVVPEDVAVEVDVEPRFSSVDVKVPDRPAAPRAVVTVGGSLSMGSISVRRPGWRRRRQLRKASRTRQDP
ncbi:DUF1707 SHOCT-like domain-containing protein [Jiangella mangrovi]|uniref:DUF1707 domain-containing protein n=1 Tax=Jiangella mangrovi TaxID=1524084 RepID=A0A7W9LMX7_9ACTN|nr:DUF1707 domain-containing protein [Jiangella mangrovi]MBB5789659.1 hypothetical protein [Jiangella mangrovi]